MSTDYRLAPHLTARLFGLVLLLLGGLVFLATVLVLVLDAPVLVLTAAVVLTLVGVCGVGFWLGRAAYVVRTTADGYRVRFVRGAGVRQARWADVEEAVTDTIAGAPCLVLRLRDGGSTTIPVEILAADREAFVRDIQARLAERGFKRPQKRRRT
ncbi:hypothetical protein [Nocardioides sp. AE5]|uniref:hypothetical protein n=1 Tax=Nocardioides sp. AE5 TaxID=2962573 RepID=UPI002881C4E3|nr:hypothetical protein [Nocardioides sp. AE5]MDT0202514.1 hypothetical protein [Nocardioides sp. AE5]